MVRTTELPSHRPHGGDDSASDGSGESRHHTCDHRTRVRQGASGAAVHESRSARGSPGFGSMPTDVRDVASSVVDRRRARALSARRRRNRRPPIHHAASVRLSLPSNDTAELLQAARQAIATLYVKGTRYSKAGVLCVDLGPSTSRPQSLFTDPAREAKRAALLAIVDSTNARWRGALGFAAAGVRQPWAPRAQHRSPRWTTSWDEIPEVR